MYSTFLIYIIFSMDTLVDTLIYTLDIINSIPINIGYEEVF